MIFYYDERITFLYEKISRTIKNKIQLNQFEIIIFQIQECIPINNNNNTI